MSDALIALCDVTFSYPGAKPLFEGFEFSLSAGDRVALTGPNGSGKSTLLHLITGLLRPQSGRVWAFGKNRSRETDFREVRRRAGYLLQDSDDQLFSPTVLDDVMFGPLNYGLSHEAARERARRVLTDLGLRAHEERVTYKLSGGEKRLVALASVLAMEPDVLLLDEPTAGLDVRTEARLVEVLTGLPQDIVLVSHNAGFMEQIANRYVPLDQEQSLHRP